MKLFKLLLAVALIVFFYGCDKEYQPLTLQKDLTNKIDALVLQVDSLKQAVELNEPEKQIKKQFQSCRFLYKKIEWAVEYFTPDPARFINGPALDELEVDENKFLPPAGFQVIEELIFPKYESTSKADLIREILVLKNNLLQVKKHVEVVTISPEYVMDATRMEVYRILTLGITGFDSPIALQSVSETKYSLESIGNTVKLLSLKSSANQDKLLQYITNSVLFCEKNENFNSFNRLDFINNYLNPISRLLLEIKKENKIPNVVRNNAINPEAATLFETNSFNVNAFIPSEEYRFSNEKAKLGEKLFYEQLLSQKNDRSCASCHHPDKAFTDGLKTNISLKGKLLSRNTPTLTYAAFQNAQFWDMRQPDLEKQSLDVIQNKEEMHGNLANSIIKIKDSEVYKDLFSKAFPKNTKIEEWQLQNALASYIRTLNKFNSKFDLYMHNKSKNFNEEEKLGFNLFAGKAKCATCHFIPLYNGTVPPIYRKTEQEVIGTPSDKNNKSISPDLGRFNQYRMAQLKNAFKTPTIRNSEKTAPYMHNGVFQTLEEVIDFYNKGGGIGHGYEVENQTLPSDSLNLTAKEQKALIAFIKTLTDQ